MKRIAILLALLLMNYIPMVSAGESAFDNFLTRFDYETRADMKIDDGEVKISGKVATVAEIIGML